MAMTPEEKKEFDELKMLVKNLLAVSDVPFIENAKRRIAKPYVESLGLDDIIVLNTTGGTSGILQAVDESGSGSYSVADAFDGSITIQDSDGNTYKIGYYTP